MNKLTNRENDKPVCYNDNSTMLAVFNFIKLMTAAVIGLVIDTVLLLALFIDGETAKFPDCSILFRLFNR